MKKVIGLAMLASLSLFATPVLAGEAFVTNENAWSHSNTTTDLDLYSTINSTRNEDYAAVAAKVYLDGSVKETCTRCGGSQTSYEDFTKHIAGSILTGSYEEIGFTKVTGTIFTEAESGSDSHTSSAGVR